MTNPDRMRLEEISFPECLSAAVFNLHIQIMFTGTRGGALLLQPRSRCSGWAALGLLRSTSLVSVGGVNVDISGNGRKEH